MILEKKDLKKVWHGIITYPIFLSICFAVNVAAFFNTNMVWKPIKHVSSVRIKDIQGK